MRERITVLTSTGEKMPKAIIARVETKLDDLITNNKDAHDAILTKLDRINGTVQEHGRKIAVCDERADNQTWVNRAIYGAIAIAVVLSVLLG
jgi:hypothetical protein